MSNQILFRCLVLLLVVFSSRAQAQDGGLPLWEAGVIGGGVTSPAYPGSTERLSLVTALPYFIYRGEILRIDRSGLGARLVHSDDFELDAGFSGSLPASSKDIQVRSGMDDLGTLVEFGPRAKLTLWRPTEGSRVRLELPLRTVMELGGGLNIRGTVFEPKVSLDTRDLGNGWRLSVATSMVFADNRLSDYFYGVSEHQATILRPSFTAKAGLLSTRLMLDAATNVTKDVRIFGVVRYESYSGSANSESPLMRQSNGVSAGVVVAWIFGRSSNLAE